MKYFILNDMNEPLEVEMEEYFNWVKCSDRRIIKRTKIRLENVLISTVFVGMTSRDDRQNLFETMVFWYQKPGWNHRFQRYSNYIDSHKGHRDIVKRVIKYIKEEERQNKLLEELNNNN